MKTKRVAFLLVILSIPVVLTGGQSGAEMQLKAAMQAELVDGDLRKAIDAYKAIVSQGGNRAAVARALLQLAGCYEKLGQSDARATYQQIVREYADQAEPVGKARARLAALELGPSALVVTRLPQVDVRNDVQALSPDGARALVINYDKGQNLAVYDFAARQTKLLTEFDWSNAWVASGVWSPDGRRAAYMQRGWAPDAVAELRVVTLAGDSRVIFRNEANPGRGVMPAGWLPDGRTILAVLERADGTAAIGLIPDAGGPFTPLRSFPWSGRMFRPRVSPDGRFVAYTEGATGMQDVQVISVDGRAAFRITDRPGDDNQPLWSPDGRSIVFVSTRFGGAALWAVAIKDGQAVGEPTRIRDRMEGVELLDWTARGLSYSNRLQTFDIYTTAVDRSTWQPTGYPRLLSYSRTGRNTAPVWSPDGRFFAFVSGSPAELERRYVVVLPEGGGDAREYLIPTTRYANGLEPYDLRWFGDGSGLGFSGVDSQSQPAVFHLSTVNGQWQTYPSPVKGWTRLEWNGDGTKFFYARHSSGRGDSAAIVERAVATDTEREVYKRSDAQAVALRGLRLAPDRRSLAFTTATLSEGRQVMALMVVDTETGHARTLLEEMSGATMEATVSLGSPAWSPDGRALIVTRSSGLNPWPEFRVVPLDDGTPRSFVISRSLSSQAPGRAGELGSTIREVMWSSDGARMAFMLAAFRMDTWQIENLLVGNRLTADAARR